MCEPSLRSGGVMISGMLAELVVEVRVADADLRQPIDLGDLRLEQARLHRRHPAQVVLGDLGLDRRRVLAAPALVQRLDVVEVAETEDLVRRQREDVVGRRDVAGEAERRALEQQLRALIRQAFEVVSQRRREVIAIGRDDDRRRDS